MAPHDTPLDRTNHEPRAPVSRRTALAILAAGGLGALAGPAAAQPPEDPPGNRGGPSYSWVRDVEANGYDLTELGGLTMAGGQRITDFAGQGLQIDDGVLDVTVDVPEPVAVALTLATSTPLDMNENTLVPFDAVELDSGDHLDPSEPWFRPPSPGYYQLQGGVTIENVREDRYPAYVVVRLVLLDGNTVVETLGTATDHPIQDTAIQNRGSYSMRPTLSRLAFLDGSVGVGLQVYAYHWSTEQVLLRGSDAGGDTVLSAHRVA